MKKEVNIEKKWIKLFEENGLRDFDSFFMKNETLEEISIQGKESFLEAGGEKFDTIPCLNDNEDHIKLLVHLINKSIRK